MATDDFTPDPLSAPPRAPLAFRVGVVGHRPDRLINADLRQLAEALRAILESVKSEVLSVRQEADTPYDRRHAELRAISPLAEGTDRIFAEQALGLGYTLCCVMPFHQAEFEKDFMAPHALEPDSLERFSSAASQLERVAARTQQFAASRTLVTAGSKSPIATSPPQPRMTTITTMMMIATMPPPDVFLRGPSS